MRTRRVLGGLLLFFSLGGEAHVNLKGNCVEYRADVCRQMAIDTEQAFRRATEAFLQTQVFAGTGRTLEPNNERHRRIFLEFRDDIVSDLLYHGFDQKPFSVAAAYKNVVRQMQHSLPSHRGCTSGETGPEYIRNLLDWAVVHLLVGKRSDARDVRNPLDLGELYLWVADGWETQLSKSKASSGQVQKKLRTS